MFVAPYTSTMELEVLEILLVALWLYYSLQVEFFSKWREMIGIKNEIKKIIRSN